MTFLRKVCWLVILLVLGGCASTPQTEELVTRMPASLDTRTLLDEVPFFPQDAYQCGPAALATILVAGGVNTHPDQLVPLVYVPGKQGSFQIELLAATRTLGRIPYVLAPSLEDLLNEVRGGSPVLVLQNLGLSSIPQWHFAVVKGYDLERRVLILNSGTLEDYEAPMTVFERTWSRAGHWAFVALTPGQLPVTAEMDAYFRALADFEQARGSAQTLMPAYEAGLARWPDSRNLLMGYGNLLYAKGDLAGSRSAFERVTAGYPDYAPGFNNLAHVLYELGHLEQALVQAELALRYGSGDAYLATWRKIERALNAQ